MSGRPAFALLLLLAGCAEPPPPALWQAERGRVWCYRTLAEPECYAAPAAGDERRLIAAAPSRVFTPKNPHPIPPEPETPGPILLIPER